MYLAGIKSPCIPNIVYFEGQETSRKFRKGNLSNEFFLGVFTRLGQFHEILPFEVRVITKLNFRVPMSPKCLLNLTSTEPQAQTKTKFFSERLQKRFWSHFHWSFKRVWTKGDPLKYGKTALARQFPKMSPAPANCYRPIIFSALSRDFRKSNF